jgi:putative SOS response-associated peptidase YedK
MGRREGATDLRLGRALAGKRRMGASYSGAMADCNDAIRPLHDRMPVLLHPHEYEQWLRGSFEDLLAFQKRCFHDDLIEIQPTRELWVKRKAPASSEASSLL